MKTLVEMVNEIAGGCVEPNPYTRGTENNVCRYCPFSAVCHEAEVEGRRNRAKVDAKNFWAEIERKTED